MKISSDKLQQKSNFLDVLHQRPVDRTPVWLMRQAGRFLPEYQALKKDFSMQQLFYEKQLIKQITKMPLERFPLDAAIIFSDILLPLEAIGAQVVFEHQKPPRVEKNFDREFHHVQACSRLFSFVYEAISELKKEIHVPLIGFCGGPLTLLTYLFPEKKEHGEFHHLKKWQYENPIQFQEMIDRLTEVVIEHLKMQIVAGVDAYQVFDSWAGRFPTGFFQQYAVEPAKKIHQALKHFNIPMIYFSRNLGAHRDSIWKIRAEAVSLDGSFPIEEVVMNDQVFQGAFDPALLLTNPDIIRREVFQFGNAIHRKKWIANLGHGVLPETPIENVRVFIEAIHSLPSS